MLKKSNSYLKLFGLICLSAAFFTACGTNMVLDPAVSASPVEGTEITVNLQAPVIASASESVPLYGKAVVMPSESIAISGTVSILDLDGNLVEAYDQLGELQTEFLTDADGNVNFTVPSATLAVFNYLTIQGTSDDGSTILKKLITNAEATGTLTLNEDTTIELALIEQSLADGGGSCANVKDCLNIGENIEFIRLGFQDFISTMRNMAIGDPEAGSEDTQEKWVPAYNVLRAAMTGQFGRSADLVSQIIGGTVDSTLFDTMGVRVLGVNYEPGQGTSQVTSQYIRNVTGIFGAANQDPDIKATKDNPEKLGVVVTALTKTKTGFIEELSDPLQRRGQFISTIAMAVANDQLIAANARTMGIIAGNSDWDSWDADRKLAMMGEMRNLDGGVDMDEIEAQTFVKGTLLSNSSSADDFRLLLGNGGAILDGFINGYRSDPNGYMNSIDIGSFATTIRGETSSDAVLQKYDTTYFQREGIRPADYVPPNVLNFVADMGDVCHPQLTASCSSNSVSTQVCNNFYTKINNINVNCFWNGVACFPTPPEVKPCTVGGGPPPPPPGGAIMLLAQSSPGFSVSPSSFYCHTGGCSWTNQMDGKLYTARQVLTQASLQPVQARFEYAPPTAATAIQVVANPGGDTYFWTDNTGLKLYSAPQGGLGPVNTILTSAQAQGYKSNFIVIGTNAFWTGTNSGKIRRIPINITDQTDGNVVTVKSGLLSPRALSSVVTPDGTFLLFSQYDVAEPNKIRIYKLPLPVNGATPTLLATEIRGAGIIPVVTAIHAAGALVAWISVNVDPVTQGPIPGTCTVNGVGVDGTGYQAFQAGLANAVGVRVSSGKIFITDMGNFGIGNPAPPLNDGKVLRYSVPPAPQPDILVNGIAPLSINIVGDYVFYSTMAGTIGRVSATQPPL